MQIDLKLKEIKKFIEDEYPYYGKEKIIYDNGTEYDGTQAFDVNIFENNLEEVNENNNANIEEKENVEQFQEDNIENGGDELQNQNQIYNYERNKNNQVSEKSKEILRRHLEKKKMIKENMEIAKTNIRVQDLTLDNRNVVA